MGSEWFSPFFTHFPFFYAFCPFFSILPLFLRFSLLLLKDKGKQQQFTAKMGNFTPTPSAPTPCKTSRELFSETSCDMEAELLTKKNCQEEFVKRAQDQPRNASKMNIANAQLCWDLCIVKTAQAKPHLKIQYLQIWGENYGSFLYCRLPSGPVPLRSKFKSLRSVSTSVLTLFSWFRTISRV